MKNVRYVKNFFIGWEIVNILKDLFYELALADAECG